MLPGKNVADVSLPQRVGQASSPPVDGASLPRGSRGKMPSAPADRMSARHDAIVEYWRWCPRCGHELHNEKCKLHCPRCHYFMSCSDFD